MSEDDTITARIKSYMPMTTSTTSARPGWSLRLDPVDELHDRLITMQEYSYTAVDLKKIRALFPDRLNGAWTRAQWVAWFAQARVKEEDVNWAGLEEAYGFKVEVNEWGEVSP